MLKKHHERHPHLEQVPGTDACRGTQLLKTYGRKRPRSCSKAADDLPGSFWKKDAMDRARIGFGPPKCPVCSAISLDNGPSEPA